MIEEYSFNIRRTKMGNPIIDIYTKQDDEEPKLLMKIKFSSSNWNSVAPWSNLYITGRVKKNKKDEKYQEVKEFANYNFDISNEIKKILPKDIIKYLSDLFQNSINERKEFNEDSIMKIEKEISSKTFSYKKNKKSKKNK